VYGRTVRFFAFLATRYSYCCEEAFLAQFFEAATARTYLLGEPVSWSKDAMPSDVMVWAANLKSMPGIIEQRNVRTDELVAKPLNY
jgi:hypothetical protein